MAPQVRARWGLSRSFGLTMSTPDLKDLSSDASEARQAAQVEATFRRLVVVAEKDGIVIALADCIGTVMGVAHFLKSLGLKGMAKSIWSDAQRYVERS